MPLRGSGIWRAAVEGDGLTDEPDDFDGSMETGPPPARLPQGYADELIETIERMIKEDVLPDAPSVPLRYRACVTKTSASLKGYEEASGENLLPIFDLLLNEFWSAYGSWRFCLLEEPDSVPESWKDLSDRGRGLIAWLRNPSGTASQLNSRPRRPVELNGEGQAIIVRGTPVNALTNKQYAVIKMLHDFFPAGVTMGQFESDNILNPHKTLASVSNLLGWKDVIQFPGGKGKGGYSLKPW